MSRLSPSGAERARLVEQYPAAFAASRGRRAAAIGLVGVVLGVFVLGIVRLDFDFSRLGPGLRQLVWFLALMIPPTPGDHLALYLHAMAETLSIALLGTLLASVFAFVGGFLAARNVLPLWIARFSLRRLFDAVLDIRDALKVGGGALAKLLSEAVENIDDRQVEGVRAAGGDRLSQIRFGLLPQVLPVIAGQILYFIESNTRSATIIGIVGAGGIGLHLAEQIRTLEWDHVSFIVLLVLVAVASIDFISSRLRAAIMLNS